MACWDMRPETRRASPPACTILRHGASQPVGKDMALCLAVRISSFNFGMPQTMLTSTRQWRRMHERKLRDISRIFGPQGAQSDLVLGSEMGGSR